MNSRRIILKGGLASIVAVALRGLAFGQAQAISALQAAGFAVSIISAISRMRSDQALQAGTENVLGKLDIIIANQELILDDLRALRVYIDEALLRSWRDAYARTITSLHQRLRIYSSELESQRWRLSPRLIADFESLSREATTATISIGQMDPWAFISFCTGVSIVLYSDSVLASSKARIVETKFGFIRTLDSWLNVDAPRSLPTLIAATAAEVSTRIQNLDGRSREFDLGNTPGFKGECNFESKDTLSVTGSYAEGFVGSVSSKEIRKGCNRGSNNHGQIDRPPGLFLNTRLESSLPVTSNGMDDVLIPAVPAFVSSSYAIVDGFNRERVAIYALSQLNARQRQLAVEMMRVRTSLRRGSV